jgi:hypothetical protein
VNWERESNSMLNKSDDRSITLWSNSGSLGFLLIAYLLTCADNSTHQCNMSMPQVNEQGESLATLEAEHSRLLEELTMLTAASWIINIITHVLYILLKLQRRYVKG